MLIYLYCLIKNVMPFLINLKNFILVKYKYNNY